MDGAELLAAYAFSVSARGLTSGRSHDRRSASPRHDDRRQ